MAGKSARLIVCRFGCDLMSMCVVVCVRGFTITAPSMGLPDFLSIRVNEGCGVTCLMELAYGVSFVVRGL
jgi:hypothetical protein